MNDSILRSGLVRLLPLLLATLLVLPACGEKAADDRAADDSAANGTPAVGGDLPPTLDAPGSPPLNLPPMTPPAMDPKTVVCTVDGDPITVGDIDAELINSIFRGRPPAPQQMQMVRMQLGKRAEKTLIERKLVEKFTAKENPEVKPEELAARWKEVEKTFPPGIKREDLLKRNGMTQEVADQRLTQILQIEKVLDKHAPIEPVADEALQKYYDTNPKHFTVQDQVQARHILIPVKPTASDEDKAAAKKKLEGIRAEIVKEKGGTPFADMARQHSSCSTSAKGGDLGLFGRGKMVPEFEALAFTQEPGAVSEPFVTQFGYHILEVTKKQPGGKKTFEEVKAQIKAQLEGGAKQKAQGALVERLRKAAKIEHPGAKPKASDTPAEAPGKPLKTEPHPVTK